MADKIDRKRPAPAPAGEGEPGIEFKCKKSRPFQTPPEFQPIPVLKEWDPEHKDHRLPPGFFLILEGSRRIGKSVSLKWLLQYYQKDFDLAIVMSETSHNGYWQPIVGNQYVHTGYNPYLITLLVEDQVKRKKAEQDSGGRIKCRRVLVILDDVIGDRKKVHEDTELNRMAVQGRHVGISIALCTQDPKAIHSVLRNNADAVFVFQQKNFRGKEAIYNDFINIFERKRDAIEMMKRYTKDHDFLIIELYKLNENPEKMYFYVKGKTTFDEKKDSARAPDYQLGSEEQKRLAKTAHGKLPLFETV